MTTASKDRTARSAAALRANLQRRKQQARAQHAAGSSSTSLSDVSGQADDPSADNAPDPGSDGKPMADKG